MGSNPADGMGYFSLVFVVCYVVIGLCDELSSIQRTSTGRACVRACVISKPQERRPGRDMGCSAKD